MKKFINISFTFVLAISLHSQSYAQCPVVPACTQTAVSGTSYPVGPGVVLCINSNYNSGTITLSGGTVIVQSGGTLNSGAAISVSTGTVNIASGGTLAIDIQPSTSATVNACGTLSGTRQFNDKTTLNYYGTANYSLNMSTGTILNNYSTTANVTLGALDNTNTKTINNFGTIPTLSISGWNQPLTINNSGTLSTGPGTIKGGSVINNTGTMNWSSQFVTGTGTQVSNSGTFNFTNASTANFNASTFTNTGTANFTQGPTFQGSPSTVTNAGTFNVTSGKTDITGSTQFTNTATGIMNTKDLIVQSTALLTNNGKLTVVGELRPDSKLTMGPNSTTTTTTLYLNSSSVTKMDDHSLLNITNNIPVGDATIQLISGCASIIGSNNPSTGNNAALINSPNMNFCGSAPTIGPSFITITAVANNSSRYRISLPSGPATNGYIQISGVTGVTNINGYWQVINNGDGTYDLIGSTFTAGAVFGSSKVIVDQSKLKLGTGSYLGYSGCANPCAPLPIKLVSFTAVKDNGNVKITWQTIEERNNDYYAIERSIDGINFETISIVRGNKNSSSLITYTQYDDAPPLGTTYYRLKQVDFSGAFSYSSIVAVEFDNQTDWIVYPNPSKDGSFTITSAFADNEVVTVTVTDVTGNRVRYYDNSLYAQEMQVSDLSSGLYIVSIQTVSELLSKKLVVQ